MKYTAQRPVAVIGQPFAKGAKTELNDGEVKAVVLSRLDTQIRWSCSEFAPGDAPPPAPLSDADVADRAYDGLLSDLGYPNNETLIRGVRLLGGVEALRSVIVERVPAVRRRVEQDAARRGVAPA